MSSQANRILRNYRNMAPTRFHNYCQRVSVAVSDKTRFPEWIWASNPTLLPSFLAACAKHDPVYHESLLGSKLVIAERLVLQEQLVNYLDEIAVLLEVAAMRVPDILIASGFELAKERRSHGKARAAAAARQAAHLEQEGGETGPPA